MNAHLTHRQAIETAHMAVRILLCAYILMGCGESTLQSTQVPIQMEVREQEQTHEWIAAPEFDALENYDCGAKTAHVEGEAVDESGPLSDQPVVVCPTYASGVKLCLGPIYTDVRGRWQLPLPADQGCITSLSVRVSDPSSAHPALSCHISELSSETLSIGKFFIPTLKAHGDAHEPATLEVGPMRLTYDGDNNGSDMETLSWATIQTDRLSHYCRFDLELARIAIWPDGPADGVSVTSFELPNVPSGTAVELHLIGGLYSMVEDTLIPEGTLHKLGRGYVEDGVAQFNLELDNFGWFLVSATPTDGENRQHDF